MKERSALAGSLIAAFLASACCIGPLLLGTLGLGTLGFASALAPLRPWLLGVTGVLLVLGFYFSYRPQRAKACAPGEGCATASSRTRQRVVLWISAVLALAVATYPGWGARPAASRPASASVAGATTLVILDVRGMTCDACAGEIEHELLRVPGVAQADVSFEQRRAEVRWSSSDAKVDPLLAAVEKAGYQATVAGQ